MLVNVQEALEMFCFVRSNVQHPKIISLLSLKKKDLFLLRNAF